MNHKISSLFDYTTKYENSISNPEDFWGEIAEDFHWRKPWSKVLDWNFEEPKMEWFKD